MKYFKIEHAINEHEIGSTYPQSQTARHSISIDDPKHLWKQEIGKFAESVHIPQPVVHPNAVLTDLVSSVVTGFRLLISEKLKDIVEKYVVTGECDFLTVPVHYVNQEYQYWIINPIVFRMDLVNYPAADIWLTNNTSKANKIDVTDATDFIEKRTGMQFPNGIIIYDFTFFDGTTQEFIQLKDVSSGYGYYVSDKLKTEIEQAGCTGIHFEEVKG